VLIILRAMFVLALGVVAITFIRGEETASGELAWFNQNADLLLISCLGIALVVIAVDIFIPQKSLKSISGLFFGIVVGMTFAFGMSLIVDLLVGSLSKAFPQLRSPVFAEVPVPQESLTIDARTGQPTYTQTLTTQRQRIGYSDHPVVSTVKLSIGVICCYLTVSFILQTKDDIRFVIPYVEFSKQAKGGRPLILDTSAIIDGRISDLAATRIFESELIVPRFVLAELQAIADSQDKLKRNRGRRGLDVLHQLQASDINDVNIMDVRPEPGGATAVDERLVDLAQKLDARIATTDYNLNQVSQLRGVDVINVNDLANALKPIFLPGESMQVKIIKQGEEAGQGIGYLEDGTMVVVEDGREFIGQLIPIAVTSALQTSAGRMIFGRPAGQSVAQPRRPRSSHRTES
jgi:uncharacterized protein YacL